MGRGYHLIPKIAIQKISNNTNIKVIINENEGNVTYFLEDSYKNTCFLNMSSVYSNEEQMDSVYVRVLDFYGNNSEWHILSELHEKVGVLFYSDSMISDCIYERRSLKKGEVLEFTRNVLGPDKIDDSFFSKEEKEEVIIEFEIEEESNYLTEEDDSGNDYGVKTDNDEEEYKVE